MDVSFRGCLDEGFERALGLPWRPRSSPLVVSTGARRRVQEKRRGRTTELNQEERRMWHNNFDYSLQEDEDARGRCKASGICRNADDGGGGVRWRSDFASAQKAELRTITGVREGRVKNNHQSRELDRDNNFSRTIYTTTNQWRKTPNKMTSDVRRRRSIVPRRSSCGAT